MRTFDGYRGSDLWLERIFPKHNHMFKFSMKHLLDVLNKASVHYWSFSVASLQHLSILFLTVMKYYFFCTEESGWDWTHSYRECSRAGNRVLPGLTAPFLRMWYPDENEAAKRNLAWIMYRALFTNCLCMLHLQSTERNSVITILGAEIAVRPWASRAGVSVYRLEPRLQLRDTWFSVILIFGIC